MPHLPFSLSFSTPCARAYRAAVTDQAGRTSPPKPTHGRIVPLPPRRPAGAAVISATNGKTTTAAMAAEILRPRCRLAHNAAGANLVSGVASALLGAGDAELGLFEVDEGALPELV